MGGESNERARLLYRLGRYPQAREELARSLAADPDDAYAHALLALCHAAEEQWGAAVAAAKAAVAGDAGASFSHYALAFVLKSRGFPDQALASALESIRVDPDYIHGWHLLGQIRLDQREWKEAVRCARQGLALQPDDEGCNTVLAAALIEMGYHDEAAEVSARLLAAHPESATAHAIEGWRLYHLGQLAGSRAAFRESLRLDPSQSNTHGGLRKATKHDTPFMRLLRLVDEPLTRRAARLQRPLRGIAQVLIVAFEFLLAWVLVVLLMIVIGLLIEWSAGTPIGP
ncbi:MAG TPA: tetratricopeptide repeat protein [Longimicrobium sp.]